VTPEEHREYLINFTCTRLCPDKRQLEHLRENMTFHLENMDDETLFTVAELADLCPQDRRYSDESGVVISLIFEEEEVKSIQFFGLHLEDFRNKDISLQHFSLLLSSVRYLELVSEGEDYPHMKSHYKLMRYQYNDRTPHHHDDDMLRLVHEYPDKSEDIVNIVYREGIRDAGLVREHLKNAAPALKDGLL
jgi:hypothetical protein